MVTNILNCQRELGCKVLYQGQGNVPPIATEYLKTTRKKGYSTYTLYSRGDVYSELYVNSCSIILLHVISTSHGDGQCTYNSKIIELENDLSNLSFLMKYLIPESDVGHWDGVTDSLMVCILRDTVNVLQDVTCSNCINRECVFRNTGEVCYAYA